MSNEETKFKIWDYVRLVKCANTHEIASTLRLPNNEVFAIVHELQRDNYLKLIPIPMDKSRDCGSYYAVTEKKFVL